MRPGKVKIHAITKLISPASSQFHFSKAREPYTNVVVCSRMIEFCKTPIDEFEHFVLRIDDDILRLHVPMHDTLTVAEIQSLHEIE